MSDLPPGWERTSLGEVLERIETGKSFSAEGRPALPDEWGVIKVSAMTYGSFRENENKAVRTGTAFSEAAEIKPGDVLLSRANTRDYVGASVLVDNCRPRLLLSDKSLRLVPADAIDRHWLWYALSSPPARLYMSNASSGVKAGMRNISQDSLRSMPLMIPPLEEQRRIVAALEDHLSRLDAGARTLASLQPRIRRLTAAELYRLTHREGRNVRPLSMVAEVRLGRQRSPKNHLGDSMRPYVRAANVGWKDSCLTM
jgi:type I restriction enzyme, S subunit